MAKDWYAKGAEYARSGLPKMSRMAWNLQGGFTVEYHEYARGYDETFVLLKDAPRCSCGRELDENGEHDGGYGAWCG